MGTRTVRAVKSLPGRFDSIENKYLDTRYCNAFPTSSSWHRVNLGWRNRATNRTVHALSSVLSFHRSFLKKNIVWELINSCAWSSIIRPSRSNLWNLSTSKGTFRCLENIFHSVTIDIRIHLDTRYRDAYMINGEQEEARKLRREQG